MEYYVATAKLLQKNVLIKELTFKSYRSLLKCLIDDNVSSKILFKNFNQLIKEATDLSYNDIINLTYIDYILLLIYIRAYSLNDTLTLQLQEENKQPYNIHLSLDSTIEYFLKQSFLLKELKITHNNINIELQLPSIDSIYNFSDIFQDLGLFAFVNNINTKKDTILFSQLTNIEQKMVIESLPINTFSLIKQKIESLVKDLNELNFFSTIASDQFNKKIPISPDWNNICYILKLVYNSNLENIYDYIFILTKVANFTSEYLDSCTPGEVFLYMKKIEETYSESTTNMTNQTTNLDDDLSDEDTSFSDLPPINLETPTAEF